MTLVELRKLTILCVIFVLMIKWWFWECEIGWKLAVGAKISLLNYVKVITLKFWLNLVKMVVLLFDVVEFMMYF